MADWKYGVEGRTYRVTPGSLWEVRGRQGTRHLFICGDLMASNMLENVVSIQEVTPTLTYCDPPWNQSNINAFRTKAALDKADHSYLDLYRRVIALAARYRTPLYLEGGRREAAKVRDLLGGGPSRTTWDITYYGKKPCVLHYSGPTLPAGHPDLNGMDDEYTLGAILKSYAEPGTALDPCGGRGLVARHAESRGWSSVLHELNQYRVSAALSRLAAQTGHEPRRIG